MDEGFGAVFQPLLAVLFAFREIIGVDLIAKISHREISSGQKEYYPND
jgi:hypothetical protein